jgi:Protein of unknown function (DUF3455)
VVWTVIDHSTPDPDSIPWLLLASASMEEPGVFRDLTYLQRVSTVGCKAAAVTGDYLGQMARMPCRADDFFYRAGH